MKRKKGLSLIVLIITVIIVIILAAVVILTLSKNNPIESGKEATFKEDIRTFQEDLAMYVNSTTLNNIYGDSVKITTNDIPSFSTMKKYISSFTKKYYGKLGIEENKLVYFADKVKNNEKKWLDDLGIGVAKYYVTEAEEEAFLWSGTTITGYDKTKMKKYLEETGGVLKIPSKCTCIGYRALGFNNPILEMENIIFPEGLTSIEQQAFYNCNNLKSIYIPKSVTNISETGTFDNCNSLEKIEVDPDNLKYSSQDGVLYNKEKTILIVAPEAIHECTLPEGLITIKSWAFYRCRNLNTITFPSTLKEIGHIAFGECKNLTGTIELPDRLEILGTSVFYNCNNITKVIIGKNLNTITGAYYESRMDTHAFLFCSSLNEFEVSPENSKYSAQNGILFNKDKTKIILAPIGVKLNNYSIPITVNEIGEDAFNGCKNISGNINIPNSVTKIGAQSFAATSITGAMYIPASVIDIYINSFSSSENITEFIVDSENPNYSSDNGIMYNKDKSILMYAPRGLNVNNLTLPNEVRKINSGAFYECKGISGKIVLNDNLQEIGSNAFFQSYNIDEVIIPSSVEIIGSHCFYNVKNVKCRLSQKPNGWDNTWCIPNSNVTWGYTGD